MAYDLSAHLNKQVKMLLYVLPTVYSLDNLSHSSNRQRHVHTAEREVLTVGLRANYCAENSTASLKLAYAYMLSTASEGAVSALVASMQSLRKQTHLPILVFSSLTSIQERMLKMFLQQRFELPNVGFRRVQTDLVGQIKCTDVIQSTRKGKDLRLSGSFIKYQLFGEDDWDGLLYLDIDTYVLSSPDRVLCDLWSLKATFAVAPTSNTACKLGVRFRGPFNSGVWYIRPDRGLQVKIFAAAATTNKFKCIAGDQKFLHHILKQSKYSLVQPVCLSREYNCQVVQERARSVVPVAECLTWSTDRSIKILHWSGNTKPSTYGVDKISVTEEHHSDFQFQPEYLTILRQYKSVQNITAKFLERVNFSELENKKTTSF